MPEPRPRISPPAFRRLRGYAFDPSLSTTLDTAAKNEALFRVPWEKRVGGPVGEYLDVVDYNPASERFYDPADLDHPHVLAQDGLPPCESLPQAHQQMVYAVAMGVGFALFLPVCYAAFGFITGVVGAALYNLAAKIVGGIEVEVE